MVEFATVAIRVFNDIALKNKTCSDLILGDVHSLRPYSMGLVDDQNRVNSCDRKEFVK